MKTPIFDQVTYNWQDAIKSAEARAIIEQNREMLALLKTVRNPTKAVKDMIVRLSK
jgi:uncharacterized protein involved in tolerance to divalent cations